MPRSGVGCKHGKVTTAVKDREGSRKTQRDRVGEWKEVEVWGEDVKTEGSEQKMELQQCSAAFQQVFGGVTLVAKKSIDCYSSHYSPSQDTESNNEGLV